MKVLLLGLFIPIAVVSCTRCTLQLPGSDVEALSILTYNVENLFDDVDNDSEYYEYDPGGGEWSTTDFHTKLVHVAEVLKTAVEGGADIVALQEIENQNTLAILNDEYLKGMRYRYSALIPTREAAVNTAVLSRFPLTQARSHAIRLEGSEGVRNILEVGISVNESKLVLFNNHWKSKSGGAEQTEALRVEAAGVLARRIRELRDEAPGTDIVAAGDFNENIDEYIRISGAYQTGFIPAEEDVPAHYRHKSLFYTREVLPEPRPHEHDRSEPDDKGREVLPKREPTGRAPGTPSEPAPSDRARGTPGKVIVYSCWTDIDEPGSYLYRGSWETIDNILLTRELFDSTGLTYEKASLVNHSFLLDEKGRPLRWNERLKKGYSDHLPLVAHFTVEQ